MLTTGSRSLGSRLSRVVSAGLAALLALTLVAVAPPQAAQAADDVVNTATTTYELVPNKGILRVTVDLSVTNRVPSGSQVVPCTKWEFDPWIGYYPVASTCRQTIDYYINSTSVWLERNARKIRVTADRGAVSRSLDKKYSTADFAVFKLGFQSVFGGQTRKLHITYEIPGGKPRSASATRVGRAYANFCVFANGLDSGSVRVIVPKAFAIEISPSKMSSSPSGSRVIYRSGTVADTSKYYRCFEGTNETGFSRAEVTSPSGRTVLIEGWPEDKAWRAAVAAEVSSAVDALEKMVGRGLPGSGPITVREVSDSELGAYAGIFNTKTAVARISETYTEPGVVAHELSHAWFNLDAFAARWMSEGLALWAERVSPTAGKDCSEPGAYPGKGDVDLDEWVFVGPKSTPAEEKLVAFQYDASCWITTALGTKMGDDRMGEVIAALLDRRAAYGDEPTDQRPGSGPVDWKAFLDLVDEVGLVPAGVTDLEYAQDLLLDYGVADAAALEGRTAARAAYHELTADLGAWAMPDALRSPLETWDFREAQARVATAHETLALVVKADAALAGIDAVEGPAKAAFETATNATDLASAKQIAASQAKAANDVAGALAALDEPRDTFEEIGLMGVELQPIADQAVDAVKAADEDGASDAADTIRAELGRASGVGTQRVAFAAGGAILVLLLLAGALVILRRRRRPGLTAVVADAPPVDDLTVHASTDVRVAGDTAGATTIRTTTASSAVEPDVPTEFRRQDDDLTGH